MSLDLFKNFINKMCLEITFNTYIYIYIYMYIYVCVCVCVYKGFGIKWPTMVDLPYIKPNQTTEGFF